jgi:hypothetical protein
MKQINKPKVRVFAATLSTIQTPIARVTRFKYNNNETDYRLLQGICLLSATVIRVISVRAKAPDFHA